jgi:hypothetical protein
MRLVLRASLVALLSGCGLAEHPFAPPSPAPTPSPATSETPSPAPSPEEPAPPPPEEPAPPPSDDPPPPDDPGPCDTQVVCGECYDDGTVSCTVFDCNGNDVGEYVADCS